MASHYDTLGLTPQAGPDEVRRAYLEQARRHHPDRHGEDRAEAERRMQAVNAAWVVLGDAEARAAYDLELGFGAAVEPRPPAPRAELRRLVPLLVVLALLVVFFVLTAYAGTPRP